eukprot:CFRG6880T1
MAMVYTRKASNNVTDIGAENACAKLMQLCAAEESLAGNFEEIKNFLQSHMHEIIDSVHKMDKDCERLMVDDGITMVNCPPAPEAGDSHGGLLVRTYSEKIEDEHIVLSREIKVHSVDESKIEIRLDTTRHVGKPMYEHTELKEIVTI